MLVRLVRSLKSTHKEAVKKPLLCEDKGEPTNPTTTKYQINP